MRKENSDFRTAFVSEAGSYIDNRDYFAFVELEDMACYVIADGLDTDREVLSAKMAVSAILENFMEKPSMSRRKIMKDLEEAHEWLKFESHRVRLKASVLVVVTNYTKMVWASCGNARLYHFRGGRLNLRSRDQSLAQLLMDSGRVSEEGINHHEERGNLLNYMGKPDRFEPFISEKIPLNDGDVILLCTPGVWEQVELPEMLDALAEASDPETLTDTLEEIVLSKQQRTVSNYTAAAIYAVKTYAETPRNYKKWAMRIALLLLTMAIAGGGVWYAKAKQAAKLAETMMQMTELEQTGDEYAAAGDYAKALKAYSEAKNAASKLKDKIHFQILRDKQRVAQAVADGDEYVKDGSFDMAVDSYTKALEDVDKYKPFNAEHIEARIERSEAIAKLSEIIVRGDKEFQNQDYTSALETYTKANKMAIEAQYEKGIKSLETKIEETENKIEQIHRETQTLKADNLEKKGDRSLAVMDYASAIEAYALAQEIYQEIDKLERVLAMERKIAKAEEKLNPIVPGGSQSQGGEGASAAALVAPASGGVQSGSSLQGSTLSGATVSGASSGSQGNAGATSVPSTAPTTSGHNSQAGAEGKASHGTADTLPGINAADGSVIPGTSLNATPESGQDVSSGSATNPGSGTKPTNDAPASSEEEAS